MTMTTHCPRYPLPAELLNSGIHCYILQIPMYLHNLSPFSAALGVIRIKCFCVFLRGCCVACCGPISPIQMSFFIHFHFNCDSLCLPLSFVGSPSYFSCACVLFANVNRRQACSELMANVMFRT